MSISNLIPWNKHRSVPVQRQADTEPLMAWRQQVDRMFDDFWRAFEAPFVGQNFGSAGMVWPRLDASENDKSYVIDIELAGMDENDVELFVEGDVLVVRGEKRSEDTDARRQIGERYYGRFERRLQLGPDALADETTAKMRKGVLRVTVPKAENSPYRMRRITVEQ
ncbi:Hsp20/alpha crystallin family protein [Algiphilus sp. W345]|uniref:Hsp20/alpha crystallin family protein n=1 Tax=Banduia mediterranea TaxID=3075609 RepID=A0ABU2WID9_9GAMM|nr:Hsp20/alpha crystallin family protein [Algiphilus sp. W345]MDT0497335.1 Hsp20/alpha crystallin family protein [Algiphilus sp. W345]